MILFLTLLQAGNSNQASIMAIRVSLIRIEKCHDVDTSNDIYKLNKGSIKENHYLIVPKTVEFMFKNR